MNSHLENAKRALDRPHRVGGQPKLEVVLEGMLEAIKEVLAYLEENERGGASGASPR
jgi:hypothetical protein